jgi:hypothetical protein
LKISKGKLEAVSQRSTDNTMVKRKRTKRPTKVDKKLHRKQTFEFTDQKTSKLEYLYRFY